MTLPTSVYSLLKSMDCLFELKTQTQSTRRLFLLGSPCPTMNSRVSGGWLCKQEDEGRVGYMGASVSKTGSPSAVASSKSPHRCLTGFPSYSHLSLLPRHTVHFEHVRSRRICRSLQVPSVHEPPCRCAHPLALPTLISLSPIWASSSFRMAMLVFSYAYRPQQARRRCSSGPLS